MTQKYFVNEIIHPTDASEVSDKDKKTEKGCDQAVIHAAKKRAVE